MRPFRDRRTAGRRLAARLEHLRSEHPIVLGLPRGGVPVAAEVARALGAPLDVIVVRKLGLPRQPELGMGAIGEGGVRVLNDEVVRIAGVGPGEIAAVEARERAELERRAYRFRGTRAMLGEIDDARRAFAAGLADAWVDFASGRDLRVPGTDVPWPEHTDDTRETAVLDLTSTVAAGYQDEVRRTWLP